MTRDELEAAIAEQEEHIKRERSCRGVTGVAHQFARHGNVRTSIAFDACVACDVTRTRDDYKKRIASAGAVSGR